MKHTQNLVAVSAAIMQRSDARLWGYDLSRASGVRSGVLYPMLRRMLEQGWLTDGWEEAGAAAGRPPRRYYELTDQGRSEFGAVLSRARAEGRAPVLRARGA